MHWTKYKFKVGGAKHGEEAALHAADVRESFGGRLLGGSVAKPIGHFT